jgi:hypothetical protein
MRLAVAPLCLMLASLAHASEVHWQCSLSADLTRLHCVAAGATTQAVPGVVTDSGSVRDARAETTSKVEVRGTHFPLDTRRTWTVDLWSPPDDGAFVEQLARATMCYRTPRCQVQVDLQPLYRQGTVVAVSR